VEYPLPLSISHNLSILAVIHHGIAGVLIYAHANEFQRIYPLLRLKSINYTEYSLTRKGDSKILNVLNITGEYKCRSELEFLGICIAISS
jgi:hypothetical protein